MSDPAFWDRTKGEMMKINMRFGLSTLLAAMLLVSMAFVPAVSATEVANVTENTEEGDIGILSLQYSESINKDLGPQPDTYTEYFPVEAGADNIEVRLLVTDFDSGDYGNIHLKLYNNNNQLVASDTLYPLENYINVDYTGSISAGDWHIVVSVDDLGSNTINVAGNINVFE